MNLNQSGIIHVVVVVGENVLNEPLESLTIK